MSMFDNFLGGGSSVDMPKLSDYKELIDAQIKANRINQVTPFGSITYKTKGGRDPLSFKQWQKRNPAPTMTPSTSGSDKGINIFSSSPSGSSYDAASAYDKYLEDFDEGGKQVARFKFSPELKGLFKKQFQEDAYAGYEQDFMDRYRALNDPYREQQQDRFAQSMFTRGIPEGSDVYGDYYRPIGDEFSRADLMAAQQAMGYADQRLLNDYNRLMMAMGGSAIPVPNVDTLGPANMALNTNIANAQADAAGSLWNVLPGLAGAYMIGAPDKSWLWGN